VLNLCLHLFWIWTSCLHLCDWAALLCHQASSFPRHSTGFLATRTGGTLPWSNARHSKALNFFNPGCPVSSAWTASRSLEAEKKVKEEQPFEQELVRYEGSARTSSGAATNDNRNPPSVANSSTSSSIAGNRISLSCDACPPCCGGCCCRGSAVVVFRFRFEPGGSHQPGGNCGRCGGCCGGCLPVPVRTRW
jgi:hypothetical protein